MRQRRDDLLSFVVDPTVVALCADASLSDPEKKGGLTKFLARSKGSGTTFSLYILHECTKRPLFRFSPSETFRESLRNIFGLLFRTPHLYFLSTSPNVLSKNPTSRSRYVTPVKFYFNSERKSFQYVLTTVVPEVSYFGWDLLFVRCLFFSYVFSLGGTEGLLVKNHQRAWKLFRLAVDLAILFASILELVACIMGKSLLII